VVGESPLTFADGAIGEKLIFAVSTGAPGRSFVFHTNAIVIVTRREIDTESLNAFRLSTSKEGCIEYDGLFVNVTEEGRKSETFANKIYAIQYLLDLLSIYYRLNSLYTLNHRVLRISSHRR